MHSDTSVIIRDARPSDIPHLLVMNNAAVPAVNDLTEAELAELIETAEAALVAELDEEPVGLLLCLGAGTDYDSSNYKWLSARFEAFFYTDRIFVDEKARGKKVGEKLYQDLFRRYEALNRPFVCEVNTRPPNPGSLRFHDRLGFVPIGEVDQGTKAVVYLQRQP